jgi:membrane protein
MGLFKQWGNAKSFGARVVARMREERLSQTAAGLTFTTTLAIVPLATVALAIFTAFPIFARFRKALQEYFLEALMPAMISDTVMQFINGFADKARGLTLLGLAFLVVTAFAMLITIESTFNQIWRVRATKGFTQRMVVAWAVLTLGPVLLGVSLWLTGLAAAQVAGYKFLSGASDALLWLIPVLLSAAGWAVLYRTVPHTQVAWRHALIGALVAAVLFEIVKRGFASYLTSFANFRQLYGAFAVVPIFLLWLYVCWLITLAGAVIASILPTWGQQDKQRVARAGDAFADALAVTRALQAARSEEPFALSLAQLEHAIDAPRGALQDALNTLQKIGWVTPVAVGEEQRYSLICEPVAVTLAPLVRALLVDSGIPVAPVLKAPLQTVENTVLASVIDEDVPPPVQAPVRRRWFGG